MERSEAESIYAQEREPVVDALPMQVYDEPLARTRATGALNVDETGWYLSGDVVTAKARGDPIPTLS